MRCRTALAGGGPRRQFQAASGRVHGALQEHATGGGMAGVQRQWRGDGEIPQRRPRAAAGAILQCEGCREFPIEDAVMERVDVLLADVGSTAELEVIRFAA